MRRARRVRRLRLLYEEGAVTIPPALVEALDPILWHQPSAVNGPGYNAVDGTSPLVLSGTAAYPPGGGLGEGGQEMLRMSGSNALNATPGAFAGTGLEEFHSETKLAVLLVWNPLGSVATWQVLAQNANGANAGFRARSYANGLGGQIYINDGAGNSQSLGVSETAFPTGWDNANNNAMLVVINVPEDYIEVWVNNRSTRVTAFQRKTLAGLTFPAPGSATPSTIPLQCAPDGDFMIAAFNEIPTPMQAQQLMRYGAGLSFDAASATDVVVSRQRSWRAEPGNIGTTPNIRVTGRFDEAPILNLYPAHYMVDYDAELLGPFTQNELLTFGGGGTATLLALTDVGTTGTLKVLMTSGDPPKDNETIVGGTSGATADVNGDATVCRTTHGSLLKSSTSAIALDSQGFGSYRFSGGLLYDRTYWIEAEYADGAIDHHRILSKTLPDSRDGLEFVVASCWRWDPIIEDTFGTNSLCLQNQHLSFILEIEKVKPDFVMTVGDDGYTDNMSDDLGNSFPIDSLADYQAAYSRVWDDRAELDTMWSSLGHKPGSFSDHEYIGDDLAGADATNLAIAKIHMEQRYGRTYPLSGSLYYSEQIPGITIISLDYRTEAEIGVQFTSVAQRAQMQTDMTAAVGRGDFIILNCDFPFDDGETPSPPFSWNNAAYAAERTDIFNRAVTAGAMGTGADDRTIVFCGDHHAGGIAFDSTQQGGYDTGGIAFPATVLASRANSPNSGQTGASAVWPQYYDGGNGHFMHVLLENVTTQLRVTVTPHEGITAKTPQVRVIG